MRYITVNPKLLREYAAPNNRIEARMKNIYAQNMGGLGEYIISMIDAMRLDIMPTTSQQNRSGFLR